MKFKKVSTSSNKENVEPAALLTCGFKEQEIPGDQVEF